MKVLGFTAGMLLNHGAIAQMAMPATFQVSESGAATYSLPIQVPPGVGGIEPQLSLSYSSQSGNGPVGIGWSLGGLGAITRCSRTQAQDGARGVINYDANDRYCLDGQRLIAIEGVNGGDGTEYRTERESFARIISYGAIGSGPSWFKVWTKAGQVMLYGSTADSNMEVAVRGATRLWALSRIYDTNGNYLSVHYQKDALNGEINPDRIDYTANDAQSKSATNAVLLSYEARSDVAPLYQAGALIKNSRRLKSISTTSSGGVTSTYTLNYKDNGAARLSRLIGVTRCVGDVCLPKATFNWPDEQEGGFGPVRGTQNAFKPADGWFSPTIQNRVWVVDVNGDGLPDLIGATDTGLYWQLNTGDGLGAPQQVDTTFRPEWGWFSNTYQSRVWISDINGDGLPDIVGITDSGLYWQLNTGSTFGPAQSTPINFTPGNGWFDMAIHNRVWLVDVNGDGLPDLLGATDGGLYWQLNTGNGFGSGQRADTGFTRNAGWFDRTYQNRVWVVDLNGDGLPDILGATNSGLYWQINTGNGFGPTQTAQTTFTPANAWFENSLNNRLWIVDVNGDGLPDILGATDSGLYWQLNTGNGFGSTQRADTGFTVAAGWFDPNYQGRVWVVDVNGDGLPDILGATNSGLYWQLNTGNGFAPAQRADNGFLPSAGWFQTTIQNRVWIDDMNGDGLPDIMGATDTGFYWQKNAFADSGKANLINIFSNGLVDTNVAYLPLTNKSVYTKDTASAYPIINLQTPQYVVRETVSSDGVGGGMTMQYTYGGLKAEMGTGRGMLGFRWMRSGLPPVSRTLPLGAF